MSKNLRQKISNAFHSTFRLSPKQKQSKVMSCCSVKKPDDYEYIPYQPKQTSTKNDYIDLSECQSWSLAISKDSGISLNKNGYQLESTRIFPDDSTSLSTFSNLSSIPNDPVNYFHSDTTTLNSIPTSFECCHCHCHHYVNKDILVNQKDNYLHSSEQYQQKLVKNKIYPFIF